MDSLYIILFVLLVLVIIPQIARQRRIAAVRHILNRKQNKENLNMKELAKQFIGKECLVYTVTDTMGSIQGTVKEVTGGGLILECSDGLQAVNLEYVTRIREYPRNAKGKKKVFFA